MKALAATALLPVVLTAQAGRPCEDKPLTVHQVEHGLTLAQSTARRLDESGARVVLLARAGQDLGKYGLKWSHLGFAYRETEAQPWRVLHKLNQCGTAESAIYRQGLGEFFLDRPARYEAAFVVPTPEIQRALLPLMTAGDMRMHERRYSMVAYAWGGKYQQSNQWALETLAASQGARDRAAAQAWLRARGYQPTDLHLDTATRLGARLTRANVAFDDHPSARRFSGHIETVTVDSMFAWLAGTGLTQAPQTLQP